MPRRTVDHKIWDGEDDWDAALHEVDHRWQPRTQQPQVTAAKSTVETHHGRRALVAPTQHTIVAPLLAKQCNIRCVDTKLLGTKPVTPF